MNYLPNVFRKICYDINIEKVNAVRRLINENHELTLEQIIIKKTNT